MKDVLLHGLLTLVVALVLVLGVFLIAELFGSAYDLYYCNQMTRLNPEYNFQWGFIVGCRVQIPENGYLLNVNDYNFEFIQKDLDGQLELELELEN